MGATTKNCKTVVKRSTAAMRRTQRIKRQLQTHAFWSCCTKDIFLWRYRVIITKIPGVYPPLWLLQLKSRCVVHRNEEACHWTLGLIQSHIFGASVDTIIKLCICIAGSWHIAHVSYPLKWTRWHPFVQITYHNSSGESRSMIRVRPWHPESSSVQCHISQYNRSTYMFLFE